jgi:hypothetical protein
VDDIERRSGASRPQQNWTFACLKNARFRGDKAAGNGRQSEEVVVVLRFALPEGLSVSRRLLLQIVTVAGCVALTPVGAQAQWWRSAPADFEDCADAAEKAATKEEKAAKLSECNAKFAGRRKPGGGYTYFDFMQNRTFDIAGPNPTPEEQKKIDEEYIAYLENQRRSSIAAAFSAKQQQPQLPPQVQPVSLKSSTEKVPMPVASPLKQQAALSNDGRARIRAGNCAKGSFSCDWPRLSGGLNDLKKLFGGTQGKAKRS